MAHTRQQEARSFAGGGRQVIPWRQAHCSGAPLPQPRCQPTILRLPAAVPSTVCSIQTVSECKAATIRACGLATVSMRPHTTPLVVSIAPRLAVFAIPAAHNQICSWQEQPQCAALCVPGQESLIPQGPLTCWVGPGRSWSRSSSFPAASPSPGRGLWRSIHCTARLQGWMGEQGIAQGGGQARLIQM